MPDNDPFDYTIEPPEVADEDHVRITVRSTFDPTEPTAATDAEVRDGLRLMAGMLGRLAVHHHDTNYSDMNTMDERRRHGCGVCGVTCRGLIDPYAVLRAEDPYAPTPSVPIVEFTVPSERAAEWVAQLRKTLSRIAAADAWTPTEEQRRTRVMVWCDSDGSVGQERACAPNLIEVNEGNEDGDHWTFSMATPHSYPLTSDGCPEIGTLTTAAAVLAAVRESSRTITRVVAELIQEVDVVRRQHGCERCGARGDVVMDMADLSPEDAFVYVVICVPEEVQTLSMAAAVRALLAEVDAVDAPVKSRAKR